MITQSSQEVKKNVERNGSKRGLSRTEFEVGDHSFGLI